MICGEFMEATVYLKLTLERDKTLAPQKGESKSETVRHKTQKATFEENDEGYKIYAENFLPGDVAEINVTTSPNPEVLLSYKNFFNDMMFFFSPEKECQFSVLSIMDFGIVGTVRTLKIKNNLTCNGGTLELDFLLGVKGVPTRRCKIILTVEQKGKVIFS